jgi:hypothetical protein
MLDRADEVAGLRVKEDPSAGVSGHDPDDVVRPGCVWTNQVSGSFTDSNCQAA